MAPQRHHAPPAPHPVPSRPRVRILVSHQLPSGPHCTPACSLLLKGEEGLKSAICIYNYQVANFTASDVFGPAITWHAFALSELLE